MKSKFGLNKSVALVGILLGTFLASANAQAATLSDVFPLFSYNINPVSYFMGTVKLSASNVIVATTTVATSTNTTVTTATTATSTTTDCGKYITTYHRYGDMGSEVVKLQKFLNKYNGSNLNEKGYYGIATFREVQKFQVAHGIKATGAQYYKTTQAINAINCGKTYTNTITVNNPTNNTPTTITKNVVKSTAYYTTPSVKVYPNPEVAPTGVIKTVPTKVKATITKATTTTSFWSGVKSDFDKIKQNYKAYALVLVLVLALFWFLRKAATE